jgi:hypothetical protein
MDTKSQPKNLTAPVAVSALVAFSATGADDQQKGRKFSGTAYGGGVVADHPFFDAVIFDLASTRFQTPAPALLSHNKPIGVIENAALTNNITITGRLFSDIDDDAKRIGDTADRGMPWQMSVGIWPGSIENVAAGTTVSVNGKEFAGPLTIFRNNRIRETSFVPIGADDSTNAAFFSVSEGGQRPQKFTVSNPEGEATMPQIDQAEHDRIVAAKDAEIAELSKQVGDLNGKFSAQQKEARTKAVKELFSAIGREYKDEDAAPYLGMSDEAFSAVAKDMQSVKPPPASDPKLFTSQANKGVGVDENREAFAQRISEHVAEQANKGITISFSAAALHLKNTQEQ